MTPKEKAKELFDKYFLLTANAIDDNGTWVVVALNKSLAKQCAIIAADEALNIFIEIHKKLVGTDVKESATYKYWQEVKQEIEKI